MNNITETAIAYTNNGVLLCLKCVKRFDLTDPAQRSPEDEFLPVLAELLQANMDAQEKEFHCGVPTCYAIITTEL